MRNGILKQITELQRLSQAALKERWRELYGTEPPVYNRALLTKRLAYRLQELAYGGVSEVTRVRLREGLEGDGLDAEAAEVARMERRQRKNGLPVPGTRLVREWRGRRYEVTVLEGGFEYEGRPYRSLSAVTKAITGTHWNGPAFFGLRKPDGRRKS